MMKITHFLARDEIRKYQDAMHNLQMEIARLRDNGLAQARDFAGEIKVLHQKFKELEEKSSVVQRQLQDANTNLATAKDHEQSLQSNLEGRTQEFTQKLEELQLKLKDTTE